MRVTIPRALIASALAVSLLWTGESRLAAQDAKPVKTASVTVVTAAILLSFARFVEWPADVLAPDASLVFCATDPPMVDALREAVARATIQAHALSVLQVQPNAVPKTCGVLYASGLDARRLAQIAPTLKTGSVLSVGDSEDFIRSGGIIHLYKKNDQLRFTVNIAAAERARLRLSSKLLTLASATVVRQ